MDRELGKAEANLHDRISKIFMWSLGAGIGLSIFSLILVALFDAKEFSKIFLTIGLSILLFAPFARSALLLQYYRLKKSPKMVLLLAFELIFVLGLVLKSI